MGLPQGKALTSTLFSSGQREGPGAQRAQRLPSLHQKQGEEAGESSGDRQAGRAPSEGTKQPTKRGTKNLARDVGSISLRRATTCLQLRTTDSGHLLLSLLLLFENTLTAGSPTLAPPTCVPTRFLEGEKGLGGAQNPRQHPPEEGWAAPDPYLP